jgi:hypothetical protein
VEPARVNGEALIAALRERGLVAATAPAPPAEAGVRPWFVALLMGIAGWIAGLFVLAFIVTFFEVRSAHDIVKFGLALLGTAWILYAAGRSIVFLDQLALALSIAGQVALALYCAEKFDRALTVATLLLALQLALFVAMPDRVARALAAFGAVVAWVFVVRFGLRPHENDHLFMDADGGPVAPLFGVWTVPAELLLTWAPPVLLTLWLRRTEAAWMARGVAAWARPALTGLLLGMALGGIGAEPTSLLFVGPQDVGQQFSWWSLVPLLSIALALFSAWAAFSLRNAGLLGTAVVAALVHLARFYYLYGTTLTTKSAIMLAMGLILLGAGRLLDRHAGGAP